MVKHPTLFITHRGLYHQQAALEAAPPELDITVLRTPTLADVIAAVPGVEFLITERSGVIDADVIKAGTSLRLIQRWGSQPLCRITVPPVISAGVIIMPAACEMGATAR